MGYSDMIKGALLHDIGKFIMRCKNNRKSMTHQEFGYEWLSMHNISDSISELAARHHRVDQHNPKHKLLDAFELPVNEILIVYEADNLSSGERPDKKVKSGQWQADAPLMSAFSKLSLGHKPGNPAYNDCWKYQKLSCVGEAIQYPGDISNSSGYTAKCYADLFSSFEKDFKKLLPELSNNALLMLLEKYTSYIPSETLVQNGKPESHPDVSLFDHLKTTAAIAACLYKYMEETHKDFRERYLKDEILDRLDPRYLLVGGDFSGVQKFIYTISSKGALKTLRARSFFLELMTEHVIAKLLKGMDLPRANVIYSGGGRFYLLAPNTNASRTVFDKVGLEINDYLFNNFHGRLFLALDKVEFCGQAFMVNPRSKQLDAILKECNENNNPYCGACKGVIKESGKPMDIGQIWGELRARLNLRKNRKFADHIAASPSEFWSTREPAKGTCAVCHTETDFLQNLGNDGEEEPVMVCDLCKQLFNLGDELPDAKYIISLREAPGEGTHITIDDLHYVICSDTKRIKNLTPVNLYVLNSWHVEDYLYPDTIQMLMANYVSRKGKGSKSFDDLAKDAVGADRIGILRMDVDNLGKLFTHGLPESARTFSRLSSLSRNLTKFFKFHINELCSGQPRGGMPPLRLIEKNTPRNVTIVYAGGDDLFLTGAWSDVVETAFDVQRCFKAYTGNNPDVSISGGITVQDSKYPLYKLAEIAGDAEEHAKDNGRDSISLFYTPQPDFFKDGLPVHHGTLKWDKAEILLEQIIKPAIVSMAEYSSQENRVKFAFGKGLLYKLLAISDIWRREGKLYLPRLAYVLARESERFKRTQKAVFWEDWKKKLYDTHNIRYLRTAVIWMDLLSRRGAEDGRI